MNTDQHGATHEKKSPLLEEELTDKVLGAAFKVHNTLGAGFLEKVYENAMVVELGRLGVPLQRHLALKVSYGGVVDGDYQADLVIDGRLLVECKAVSALDPAHEAQLLNYLRAAKIRVGLLLNFAKPKLPFKRLVA